jgi:hypothetical protein
MTTSNRIPALTPQGHLVLAPTHEARTLPDNLQERLEGAFERGAGHWLLELGIREVGTVALAWLLSRSTVTSVLLGASKLEQLQNNLDALNTQLSPDQIKRLDDISRVEIGFPHAVLANPSIKQMIFGGVEVHRK